MPWSTDYLSQRQFMNAITSKLAEAERLIVPTLAVKNTEPTTDDLLVAWRTRYPDDAQIAENGRIAWLNPVSNTVVNTYRQLGTPQVITPVAKQGWFPIYERSYVEDSTVIGDQVSFGTGYTHLFFHGIIRLTAAAPTATLTLGLTNTLNVGAPIETSISSIQNAAFTGTFSINGGAVFLVAPAATSPLSSYLSYQMMIYDYQSTANKFGWIKQGYTNTAAFANRIASVGSLVVKQASGLGFGRITNTNLAKGSRLTWWGYRS